MPRRRPYNATSTGRSDVDPGRWQRTTRPESARSTRMFSNPLRSHLCLSRHVRSLVRVSICRWNRRVPLTSSPALPRAWDRLGLRGCEGIRRFLPPTAPQRIQASDLGVSDLKQNGLSVSRGTWRSTTACRCRDRGARRRVPRGAPRQRRGAPSEARAQCHRSSVAGDQHAASRSFESRSMLRSTEPG